MLNDDINLFLGVFSYPFVHIDFLHSDILQKYYAKTTPKIKDKEELRENILLFLKNKYTLFSYDEVYLYLDKWYLYPKYDREEGLQKRNSFDQIWSHLHHFSKSFISQRDGKIIYKYWENENDQKFLGGFSKNNKIYLFHCLNRLIPMDILSILYMVKNGKKIGELNGYYGNIEVSDALLDRVLEKGVAENHLHSGVAVSFLSNWDNYMMPLTDEMAVELKNFTGKILRSRNVINSKENMYLLFLANLLRYCILLKIQMLKEVEEDQNFQADQENQEKQENSENPVDEQISFFIKTFHGDLKRQLDYFCCDELGKSMEQEFLERWKALTRGRQNKDFEVKSIMGKKEKEVFAVHTSDENLFLYEVVSFIMQETEEKEYNNEEHKVVKNLFLNYLRIKNHFYQLVVQQKTIQGLNFFQKEYYRKNSNFSAQGKKLKNQNGWERALREQLQNGNLKKLEFRTSIYEKESAFKKNVDSFLKAYLNILHEYYCECRIYNGKKEYIPWKEFPKVGLVFHLLKQEQEYLYENCLQQNDQKGRKLPYSELYMNYKQQVMNLRKLRDGDDGFVYGKYLLGLDVASLENEVPTWVFSGIYENARDSKTEPINKNCGKYQNHQSLSFTFHAGEDFRHLMSGLRRIHEVISHLKFHAGDRIGHGIALGVNPAKWYLYNNTIVIPGIELLENYIWAYDLLSNHCDSSLLVNLDFIEKKIYELSRKIYGEGCHIPINTLVEAYHTLFKRNMFEGDSLENEECILKNCFHKKDTCTGGEGNPFVWDVNRLLAARNCREFAHKMNEPVHVRIEEQEVEIIQSLQKLVKQDMDIKGIIVEICPSSNVAIADLDTIAENQVYGINNYGYQFDNLIVCINSDDPAVFNTDASNELGYIYFGMLERKTNREAALAWVEKLRNNAMNASFIRRRDSDIQILRELEQFIQKL